MWEIGSTPYPNCDWGGHRRKAHVCANRAGFFASDTWPIATRGFLLTRKYVSLNWHQLFHFPLLFKCLCLNPAIQRHKWSFATCRIKTIPCWRPPRPSPHWLAAPPSPHRLRFVEDICSVVDCERNLCFYYCSFYLFVVWRSFVRTGNKKKGARFSNRVYGKEWKTETLIQIFPTCQVVCNCYLSFCCVFISRSCLKVETYQSIGI